MVSGGGRQRLHPFPHPHPARAPFLASRPLAPLAHPDSKLERQAEEQTSSYHSPYPGLYGQDQELGFPLSGSQEPSRRDSLNTVCPVKPPAYSSSGQQSYPAPWKARTARPAFQLFISREKAAHHIVSKRCQKVTAAGQTGPTLQDSGIQTRGEYRARNTIEPGQTLPYSVNKPLRAVWGTLDESLPLMALAVPICSQRAYWDLSILTMPQVASVSASPVTVISASVFAHLEIKKAPCLPDLDGDFQGV